jgi:catechol 2,3-dioxygenase-like lactoylglutathione lyase family enzyme
MNSNNIFLSSIALVVCAFGLSGFNVAQDETEKESAFSKPTIDIGCVVSDIEASVKFYTEVIGFEASGGFQVDAQYAKEVGLTNEKALDVKVLTLGEGPGATQLKLMQVDGGGAKSANDHINTTLGFSYITVFVNSTDDAIERLKAANVETVENSPLGLPGNEKVALTVVRDPDGNFVELVGPAPAK